MQGDENAKQKFIEVSEAYEVLKDDEKRARYQYSRNLVIERCCY